VRLAGPWVPRLTKSRLIGRGGSKRRPLELYDDRYALAYVNLMAHRPKPNGKGLVGMSGAVESFAIIEHESLTDDGVKKRMAKPTGRVDRGGRAANNQRNLKAIDEMPMAVAVAERFRKHLNRLRKEAAAGEADAATDDKRAKGATASGERRWIVAMGRAYHAALFLGDSATPGDAALAWDAARFWCDAINEQNFFVEKLAPFIARRFGLHGPFVVPGFETEKGAL
jgi:hypothetical protein